MDKIDLELKLLANLPVALPYAGSIFIPSFREVSDFGFSNYNQSLHALLLDKEMLENNNDKSITNFEIVFANCYHSEDFKKAAFSLLELLFRKDIDLSVSDHDIYFKVGENGRIDNLNFDQLQEILMFANNVKIEKESEFKAANSKAQEMINLIMKNRKKQPKKKDKIDLVSIVSALAWKSQNLNILNVFDLNIFQIYNGFHTINNLDDYHYTLTGLYAGTIDGKNIKMSDIHWANKLN